MTEHIQFKTKIKYIDIADILKELELDFELSVNFQNEKLLSGISDGRFASINTLCFVDRLPKDNPFSAINNNLLVITRPEYHKSFPDISALYSNDPRELFIKLLCFFEQKNLCYPFTSTTKAKSSFIHEKAIINEKAILEKGVYIDEGTIISAGVIIKKGTIIGKNCIIRENTTIGCNGIAIYKTITNELLKFPHLAGVNIGDNVEIGANAVIVKGTLKNTSIGRGTVIGNLSNIGHGVVIHSNVWISVGSMVGGNCTIEENVTVGLGVRIRDNLTISKNVSIGMGSVVTKNIPKDISIFGNPAKKMKKLTTGPKR